MTKNVLLKNNKRLIHWTKVIPNQNKLVLIVQKGVLLIELLSKMIYSKIKFNVIIKVCHNT